MRAHAFGAAVIGLATVLVAAACATGRIAQGVFRSPKGYRVTMPGAAWAAVPSEADLDLRNRTAQAAMLVHATCDRAVVGRPPWLLARHLVAGVPDRVVLERGEVVLDGRPGLRLLLEARVPRGEAPVRIEAYVVEGSRCAYDLMYAAAPAEFEAWRGDFARLVATFSAE